MRTRGPLRSVFALLSGEAINKLARFAAAVVLARSLTLAEFGVVNVAIAAAGFSLMVTNLGLPDVGARDVAVSPKRSAEVAGRVLSGRVLALSALCVVLGGALLVAAVAVEAVLLTAAMALGLTLSGDWLLRGLERMNSVALASAAGGVVVLAGSLTLVQAQPSPMVALAVFAAAEFVVSGFTWRAARIREIRRPSWLELSRAVRESWPVGLAALIVYSYYANLDTLILSIARSTAEAGLYSAPYRTFLAVNVVGTFAAYAYLPQIAKGVAAGRTKERDAEHGLHRGLPLLCAYGLFVLGGAELAGGTALAGLFGESFEEADDAFVMLCVAVPWYSVAFPMGYTLIARDANRRFLRGAAVAGALNLVLNLALIPPLGIEGAAIATAIALIAGSAVWMREHRALTDQGLGAIPFLLVFSSVTAIAAVAVPGAATAGGLATLLAALIVLVRLEFFDAYA